MRNNATLDERLRTVERRAAEAAKGAASPHPEYFAEANRSAEEMIRLISEKHEKAGVQPDVVAAAVKRGETAYRLEVTMDAVAAEALFGTPGGASKVPLGSRQRREKKGAQFQWSSNATRSFVWNDGVISRQLLASPTHERTLPDWVQSVLRLDETDQTAAALDTLFGRIDSMLSASDFDKVDGIVAGMPIEGPSLSLMMGLLSITRPAAEHLPSRQEFFTRVYRLCRAMGRDAESLLSGLR
jgi:hypothetical protein